MNISDLFSDDMIEKIKKDISNNNDNEIFFIALIDIETKHVKEYNLLARGNSNMVPAIINDLKPGSIIVHNHPSGDLTPSAADIRIASRTGNNGIGFAIINNDVSKINFIVEAKIPEKEIKINKQEIISLFKPQGKLDMVLRDYEYRKQQVEVVDRIIDSFNEHRQYLIEAGTGTGKSFAYLIPSLYWANTNKETVVISTNTINLQEQIIEKDLVLLKKVLPFSFKAVLVKGRSNYVCKRKMKNLEKRAADIFDDDLEKKVELVKILNWLDDTETGSRSELNFIVSSDLWDELKSESDLCMRTNCPHFNKCFFMHARKEVFSADLLIVNHHLLLSDSVLKKENIDNNHGILPKYKKLIIDEAHNIVEAATTHLGQPFYIAALNKYFQRLYHNKFSLIPRLRDTLTKLSNKQDYLKLIDNNIITQILKLNEISAQYYTFFEDIIDDNETSIRIVKKVKESNTWREIEEYGDNFLINIQKLSNYLNTLYQKILELDPETIYSKFEELLIELESFILKSKLLANNLDFNLKSRDSQYVFWIEKKGERFINQENAPLDISEIMNDILWSNMDTVALTSATLTVSNSFNFFKETLGLEKSDSFSIESPFDYAKQAELIIPTDISAPNSPDFLSSIITDFKDILISFGGRTLVLFTSYRMLNYCVKNIRTDLELAGINLLAQGKYSRNYIIDHFKKEDRQIIFGTVSFWEGIDVKGENLEQLIIMKLPFPVPSEPIAAARMEQMQKEGKNPFFDYSIPRAVIRFKQGFGRLIRSKQDKGIVISFDNRLITKNYGKIFLNSLPKDCPISQKSIKSIKNKEVKA
ncbi:helicase C-terminal domain-containing protein [Natronospora cellulosivora (SeqCode)]